MSFVDADFSTALAAMKEGQRVSRAGWNGADQWVRSIDLRNDNDFVLIEKPWAEGVWLPFFIIKTTQGGLVPWLTSQSDLHAIDWFSVEPMQLKGE